MRREHCTAVVEAKDTGETKRETFGACGFCPSRWVVGFVYCRCLFLSQPNVSYSESRIISDNKTTEIQRNYRGKSPTTNYKYKVSKYRVGINPTHRHKKNDERGSCCPCIVNGSARGHTRGFVESAQSSRFNTQISKIWSGLIAKVESRVSSVESGCSY